MNLCKGQEARMTTKSGAHLLLQMAAYHLEQERAATDRGFEKLFNVAAEAHQLSLFSRQPCQLFLAADVQFEGLRV